MGPYVHILPIDDTCHRESVDCWCEPMKLRLKWTSSVFVIHHDLENREAWDTESWLIRGRLHPKELAHAR
jgi:hypothetical protein